MPFRAKLFIAVVPGELPVTPDKERFPGKLGADAGGKKGLLCDQIVDPGSYQSNIHGGFKHIFASQCFSGIVADRKTLDRKVFGSVADRKTLPSEDDSLIKLRLFH